MKKSEAITSRLISMLIDQTPEAYIATDDQQSVVFWNAAAERMYGWKAAEVIGKQLYDLFKVAPEEITSHAVKLETREGKVTRKRKDGAALTVTTRVAPLLDEQGELIGFVSVDREANAPGMQEEPVNAPDSTQLEKQLIQMKRLYATLSQVNQTIVRVKEPGELFQAICNLAVQYGEFDLAWIGLLDEESGEIRPVVANGLDRTHWPFPAINIRAGEYKDGMIAIALRASRVVTSEDLQADPRTTVLQLPLPQHDYHSLAAVPINREGKTIGILSLVSREEGLFSVEEEVRLLEEMSLDISFALDAMEKERVRRQWADAFEHCGHGISLGDPAVNQLITCNPAYARLQGRTVDEITSMSILDMYAPQDHDRVRDFIAEADRTGSAQYEARMVRKDGSTYPVQMELVSVRDEQGKLLYRVATHQDITERKRGEEALRQSEERYRKTLDNMLEGCQIIDFDWRYIYINDAAARHGHSTPDKLLHHTMMEMYPGIESTALFGVLRNCMESRATRQIQNEFTYPSGEVGWFELNIQPVPDGIFILSMDITDRKRAENKLLASERTLKLFVDYAPAAIAMFDRNMNYLAASQRFLSDYRLGDQNVIGRSHYEVFPEVPERWKEIHRRCLAGATEKAEEDAFPRTDGRVDWVRWEIHPWYENVAEIGGIILFSEVITGRKEAENQLHIQLERLSALREIDHAIASSLDMRLSLDILLTQVLSRLGVDAASVLLLKTYNQTLEFAAGKGFYTQAIRQSALRLGEGFAGWAGAERKVIHIPDLVAAGDRFKRATLLMDEKFIEYIGIPLIAKGVLKGVLEIFHRTHLTPDPEWLNYLEILGGQAAIAIDSAQMFEGMQHSNVELVEAYDATIAGWSRAMDMRDHETEGHTQRVTELTVQLAARMGLGEQDLLHIRRGALLHDIGKLGVPDNVLLKPSKLTEDEWKIMRQHPTYALNMLLPIAYLRTALDIPYCHHEKWDGTGYPRGLKEEQIPLPARIFAAVDVWDALRSDRPYRAKWTVEQTRGYIVENSGKHFDPSVVEAFMQMTEEDPTDAG